MNKLNFKRAIVAMFAALALLAAGCGGGGSPEDAVSDLYSAAADGDYEQVCDLLTEEAAAEAQADEDAASCEEGTEKALSGGAGDLLGDIEVGEATIDGDTGTVGVSFAGQEDTVNVVQQDGEWKVDQD